MDGIAFLTYCVLFTSCLLSGTAFGSKDPYIFLLDVGNAGLQKATLQQTMLSVTGGSMLYRYPASGNGGIITHINVVGKDYGSDLAAVITSGGPGYQFIELTIIGQDDIPYQLLVTVEGQKSSAEFSEPNGSYFTSDDSELYGSAPSDSAVFEKNSYGNQVISAEDSSNINKQQFYYSQEQTDKELANNNRSSEYGDDGVLPSSEIGDEMYPDEPRFKKLDRYTDSYYNSFAYNVDLAEQYNTEEDTVKGSDDENSSNSNDYGNVEENNKLKSENNFDSGIADNVEEENLNGGVEQDNRGDIEEINNSSDQNDFTSESEGSNLSNDIDSNFKAARNKDFTTNDVRTNSYLVSNSPYKFWNINSAEPEISEVDSEPQQESYRMDEKADFTNEKTAPEYLRDEDELPDPALYERYKVLKPHLYGDVQIGPHGEKKDLNVDPHWTNNIKSDSPADKQNMQSHNGADNSREDDDGSYDKDDVSAALY